jgi:hypothetical protein
VGQALLSVIVRAATLVNSFTEGASSHVSLLSKKSVDKSECSYNQLMQQNKVLLDKITLIDPFIEKIQSIDFNSLSPKQAFDLLWELKDI